MIPNALCERVAHLVDLHKAETLNVLGPVVQFLTEPEDGMPFVMRGTIPPGGVVPLHSHADPETVIHLSGDLEALEQSPEGFIWVQIVPGDVFHVPGGAKHAFRNRSAEPSVSMIVSTSKIGRFFQEIGSPILPGNRRRRDSPTAEVLQYFLEITNKYGYWNATPEENARVGIFSTLPE